MAARSVPMAKPLGRARGFLTGDLAFQVIAAAMAASVIALVVLIAATLWTGSALSRQSFGWSFLVGSTWDPVRRVFGALPYIFGTVVTSIIALIMGGTLGVGTAVFLAELAPIRLRLPISTLVEMLATIPSVVYGLWALFVLVPVVRTVVEPALGDALGFLPLFQGPKYGLGILSASLVLVIMILPTITAIARDTIAAVPREHREGLVALGGTRWEVISRVVLPYARTGIIGALILGLGRALSETMAVTMVIGNRGQITASLFNPGDTMASVIANQFTEASDPVYLAALIEIGLVLFGVTVLLNVVARLLVWRIAGSTTRAVV